jgi:hypothetical protein
MKTGPGWAGAAALAALVVLVALAVLLDGCSASKESSSTRFPAPGGESPAVEKEPEKVPSPRSTFGYLVRNEDCNCQEYSTADRKFPVNYRFEASYRMEGGFVTSIRVRFENRSRDTLFLDPGAVMVSSKNIDYQYNNRFIPLPDMVILPGDSEDLDLDGKEVTSSPTWRKIAGEQLTLTLKGLRLGQTTLEKQVVTFVPENPMLRDND